jgi:TonB family protein
VNDVWLIVFVKATAVLVTAAIAALLMRRRSAAGRHLIWLTAMIALLIVPAGALLPAGAADAVLIAGAAGMLSGASVVPATGSVAPAATFVWLSGCALLLIRLAASAITVARLFRDAEPADGGVRISSSTRTPAACGFIRRAVLLPPAAIHWPDDRRRAVLLHENAHLDRGDCWALLLAELACTFYWPNPLVWYAAWQLRCEQEYAADDRVLGEGTDPAEYAAHLVAIARAETVPLLVAGAVTDSDLALRVKAILDPQRRRSMRTKTMLVMSAAALLLLAVPLAALQNQRKIHKVGEDGVTAPQVLTKIEPQYTDEARDAGIQGSVLLSGVVEVDGALHELKIVKGLDAGLDANAILAVSNWQLKPAEKNGNPVPVSVKIEVNFRLK